jgi:hypothetical protein
MTRTLLLSAAALAAVATAAAAAPAGPATVGPAMPDMAGMHAAGAPSMHGGTGSMAALHDRVSDPAEHDAMMDDPTMQAHVAAYGIDTEQMREWHDAGHSVDRMHANLAEQGIDVDAMMADCPLLSGDATSHHDGSPGMASRHRVQGGDRS